MIWQSLDRTRLGLLIRAASQNPEMVSALGMDVNLVRSAVFGIGCGLAGIGGVLAAPLVTASEGMAATMIIDAFVIVIIGGMGSFLGSLIGALLVAFIQVFGNTTCPTWRSPRCICSCCWCSSSAPAGCSARRREACADRSRSASPRGAPDRRAYRAAPFAMTLLTELVILGLFAMSLDLMVGYTRLVSFGHAAAFGIGAYASGYMLLNSSTPLLFVVFLAALMTGFIAIGVGWVCTLATGVSFSMLTLAFAQLLYAIAFKWTSVTGGSDGLAGIPRRPGPMEMTFLTTKTGFYYFALACLVGAYRCAAAW